MLIYWLSSYSKPSVDYTSQATSIMDQIYAGVKVTTPSATKTKVWYTVGVPIIAAALKKV